MDASRPADPIASAGWPPGPSRPPLPGADVHLWIANLDCASWPSATALPSPERERAGRVLDPEAGARWAASRWALRAVLGRYLDQEPTRIGLAADERGKPRLAADPARLEFNLSHSGARALIAVAVGREVGVDIERVKPGRDFVALAERSFEAAVVEAVRAAPPARRAAVFYAAWVRHEALAKCDGGGLGGGSRWLPMTSVAIEVGCGYAAALAVPGAETPRLHEWSIQPPRAESGANLR